MKAVISSLLLLLVMISCTNSLEHGDYITWVTDYKNGLHAKEQSGDFIYDLQYQPTDYVWLQRTSDFNDKVDYLNAKQDIEGLQYFSLTITASNGIDLIQYGATSEADLEQRQYYFSYRFQEDIRLEENGVKFPCVLFHFEKSVDLSPSRTFLLGFEKSDKISTEVKLIINSGHLISLPVKIKISKDNIPSLKV